jgi:hypothetical protein
MSGIMVEYDHISLRDAYPRNRREVPAVPREGESVTVLGSVFVVYRVHWWEQPVPSGEPAVRVVLRSAAEYARLRGAAGVDRPPG